FSHLVVNSSIHNSYTLFWGSATLFGCSRTYTPPRQHHGIQAPNWHVRQWRHRSAGTVRGCRSRRTRISYRGIWGGGRWVSCQHMHHAKGRMELRARAYYLHVFGVMRKYDSPGPKVKRTPDILEVCRQKFEARDYIGM